MPLFIDKVEFVSFRKLVLILCVLCGLCVNISAQEFKTLKPGVEYAEVTKEIGGKSVNMNLLRLDLTKVRLDVHHAMDAAIGTEKTSSIATRHGAFAAINAGFFRLDTSIFAGDSEGVLIIDGETFSESLNNRAAVGFFNNKRSTVVSIGNLRVDRFLKVKDKTFTLGIDRKIGKDDAVLITSRFGNKTAKEADVVEFLIRKNKVKSIVYGGGNPVGPGTTILSANGSKKSELIQCLAVGEKVRMFDVYVSENESNPPTLTKPEDVTNGVPILIRQGKIDITWEQEKASKSFVETRHPRTAVAKLKDGKFLMITVDGRSEASGGIGLQDLAEYLLSLGATDAINLDGGGSTTMFVDGKVVNKPSDKEGERKVSDAILVTLRKK